MEETGFYTGILDNIAMQCCSAIEDILRAFGSSQVKTIPTIP
jgi:hypothetical protein